MHSVFLSYTRDRRLKVCSERLGNEDKAPCPRALVSCFLFLEAYLEGCHTGELEVVDDAEDEGLMAGDHGHTSRQVPHHVVGCKPHPVLFWIQGKILSKSHYYYYHHALRDAIHSTTISQRLQNIKLQKLHIYIRWPNKNGTVETVDFSGLCSDQQLSFFTLLDRTSFPHYNNTKIIKFG